MLLSIFKHPLSEKKGYIYILYLNKSENHCGSNRDGNNTTGVHFFSAKEMFQHKF